MYGLIKNVHIWVNLNFPYYIGKLKMSMYGLIGQTWSVNSKSLEHNKRAFWRVAE